MTTKLTVENDGKYKLVRKKYILLKNGTKKHIQVKLILIFA